MAKVIINGIEHVSCEFTFTTADILRGDSEVAKALASPQGRKYIQPLLDAIENDVVNGLIASGNGNGKSQP